MASTSPAQDRKESFISEARKYDREEKYTECLRVWKQILDLNLELSEEEKGEARMAARSINCPLRMEEYSKLSEEELVIHSELAISVIDSLIQREKDAETINLLLTVRWKNDAQLKMKRKGLGSWDKMREFYVGKAREAYARFSPAHPDRIKVILDYICRLEKNETMQMEELRKLTEEVEAARGDLERMTEDERKESEYRLNAVKGHLQNIPKKNELLSEAGKYGNEKKYIERLRVWKQIVDLNVRLSDEEWEEARSAVEEINRLPREEYSKLAEEVVDTHSELANSVADGYFQIEKKAKRIDELLHERWINDIQQINKGKGLGSWEKMDEFYVEEAREAYAPFSPSNAHRIQKILSYISWLNHNKKMQMEELQKLNDEVEEWWKTHKNAKNDENLAALSKVKDEMKRLAQDRKESLVFEARKYGSEKKYTERLRMWRQIVDLSVELSDNEREEARDAASSLLQLLPRKEYEKVTTREEGIHLELAIFVLDRLIQTEKNAEMIGQLLGARSYNDSLLVSERRGLESWEKMHEFYVEKAREAYAPFSPTNPHRIKGILKYIEKLDHNERMEMEELKKLEKEVEAWWKTHPNEKNDENRKELSRVWDAMRRVQVSL